MSNIILYCMASLLRAMKTTAIQVAPGSFSLFLVTACVVSFSVLHIYHSSDLTSIHASDIISQYFQNLYMIVPSIQQVSTSAQSSCASIKTTESLSQVLTTSSDKLTQVVWCMLCILVIVISLFHVWARWVLGICEHCPGQIVESAQRGSGFTISTNIKE